MEKTPEEKYRSEGYRLAFRDFANLLSLGCDIPDDQPDSNLPALMAMKVRERFDKNGQSTYFYSSGYRDALDEVARQSGINEKAMLETRLSADLPSGGGTVNREPTLSEQAQRLVCLIEKQYEQPATPEGLSEYNRALADVANFFGINVVEPTGFFFRRNRAAVLADAIRKQVKQEQKI